MKLFEAIRLGAMMKPQAFDDYTPGHSCALQAANDAIGNPTHWKSLCRYFDVLNTIAARPDRCIDFSFDTLTDVIWHLNDDHKWTRERIAVRVETIEQPAVEQPPAEELPCLQLQETQC